MTRPNLSKFTLDLGQTATREPEYLVHLVSGHEAVGDEQHGAPGGGGQRARRRAEAARVRGPRLHPGDRRAGGGHVAQRADADWGTPC